MATFIEDLELALKYAASISRERSRSWNTNVSSLLDWQHKSFLTIITSERESSEVNTAWRKLLDDEATRLAADLLHVELRAVIDFQRPLADPTFNHSRPTETEEAEPPRRKRPLKKAVGLVKTFLESLKEILDGFLDIKGKAILKIAIEAAEAFS